MILRLAGFCILLQVLLCCASSALAGSCLELGEEQVLTACPERRGAMDWLVASACRKSELEVPSIRDKNSQERQEACRRKVLLPVYLDVCLHFRDVVCAQAFEPCWSWAREQFSRCMAGDAYWFGE